MLCIVSITSITCNLLISAGEKFTVCVTIIEAKGGKNNIRIVKTEETAFDLLTKSQDVYLQEVINAGKQLAFAGKPRISQHTGSVLY